MGSKTFIDGKRDNEMWRVRERDRYIEHGEKDRQADKDRDTEYGETERMTE